MSGGRRSTFEDEVPPARAVKLALHVPFRGRRSAKALTAEVEATSGGVAFTTRGGDAGTALGAAALRIAISTILVVTL